ncbi:uncharacterized protein LOC127834477 [Dreissena polymorpha]|uniref:Protein kinase domain-containing protein n=1 Tax=Dreissena polymorpha TaxID=45954 RepID=A0A9D4GDK2_DREPO|nr:uncharacterized protein LOC127834477 [Dreissena polymorpha]KAH3815199.1 hypothetical protein DPMN_143721 [Dreissena polymorpha]
MDPLFDAWTQEKILELNLGDALRLAKVWNLEVHGLRQLQEIKSRLLTKWKEGDGRESPKLPVPFLGGILKASQDQEEVRMELQNKLQQTEKLVQDIPEKLKSNLLQSYPSLDDTIRTMAHSLESLQCWILVAGEVGAGKSSIINLFLDCHVLPTDTLKCSNTIVEIRCSDINEARCYFKSSWTDRGKQRPVKPRVIILDDQRGIQEFKDCVTECDANDDNPYDHIELYYPFKTLSKSVVIVDIPGIGGGNNLDHRLEKYIKSAFGFVYVMNTNTAGGLSHSRLGHLLKTVVNSSKEFGPDSVLFIGNKSENVLQCDTTVVQKDIFEQLSYVYPEIRNNQIHYMSVTKARDIYEDHKTLSDDQVTLLQRIGELIPNSHRHAMKEHYWWLSSLLSRTAYVLRVAGVQHEMSAEELKRKYTEMQGHVAELQHNTDECVKKLRHKVEFEIYRITNTIRDMLEHRNLHNKLCKWDNESDCPKVFRKWKLTADEAALKISERIASVMDAWERDNQTLHGVEREIVDVFTKEFGLLTHQVHEIEKLLSHPNDRTTILRTIHELTGKKMFGKKRGTIERTYSTLGGAVSCIGLLDTNDKEVRDLFKKSYTDKASMDTKADIMAKAAAIYMKSILEHKDMSAKLMKFFERFFEDINEAARKIPIFLQADQKLIETLKQNMTQIEKMKEQLPPIARECAELHGKLDIFYVNKIMKFDIELNELDWLNKKFIDSGSFSKVFKSEWKREQIPVALKVSSSAVKIGNVTELLMEDKILRDLVHPNVIRYYGATFEKSWSGLIWIMVMELCQGSLKNLYIDHASKAEHVPGLIAPDQPRRPEAVRRTLSHARDIASGLEYIHEKRYTHRDMKPENVLIAENGVAKITDVGVAKPTDRLSFTLNGSPAYMAPEVLLGTGNQTNKIDIYSVALIYWEMWFGEDTGSVMNREILGPSFYGDPLTAIQKRQTDPRGGWRPSFNTEKAPPSGLIDLIQAAWSDNADRRPTAKNMRLSIEKLIQLLK